MNDSQIRYTILVQTSNIVCAKLAADPAFAGDMQALIRDTYRTAEDLVFGTNEPETAPAQLKPAVPVKKSVTPDRIICLEDGKGFKSLKRHLSASYGMTPDEYRTKWGLPSAYPMVAPNYARSRSELARKIGLGRKAPTQEQQERLAQAVAAPSEAPQQKNRGRTRRVPIHVAAHANGKKPSRSSHVNG